MRIPPVVKVSEGSIDINTLRKDGWHKKRIQRKKGSTVLFWNGTKMVLLQ
jgi:predicted transcriptional regulator